MTRHSRSVALSEAEFDHLLETARDIPGRIGREATFALIAGGRLGMRAGEISHLREEWVDWDKYQINIPPHDPCQKGESGGVCGYCRDRARSAVEHHDADEAGYELSMEEALAERWNPKTKHGVRAIPFDFSDEVRQEVEAFFFDYDDWPNSRTSINRRINRVLRESDYSERKTHPHGLRSTAATYHAYNGVSVAALQGMFGWRKPETASKYLRISGGATKQALDSVYSN